ncbi:MAG: HD domain-containing protein [Desulfomonilaceae bacterium]|nr:HD domain-containing protein [Desulfomonilaceae bacterium]
MKCPGQDPRFWKFDAIFDAECPNCGSVIEFFKDETRRKCKNCGHRVLNPKMDFGCATYCKFAEDCFGDLPPELIKQKEDLFKDRVAVEMKLYFKQDFKRIGHAARVARYAERIMDAEKGNPAVVLSAAYLHDIGIKEAERKHKSSAAIYQEQEGPPVARQILEKLDAKEELIDEVCDIVGRHHHPRDEETNNFKIVYDADRIVNIEERLRKAPITPERLTKMIESGFLTESGRELARRVLLNSGNGSDGNVAKSEPSDEETGK